jgi:hypothetical protein
MIYDIEIKHPNGMFGKITVRNSPSINGVQIGTYPNSTTIQGEIIANEATGDVWVKISPYKNGADGYFAIVYNDKVFGTYKAVEPLPVSDKLLARVYLNYEKEFYPFILPNHPPIPDTRAYGGASTKNNGRTVLTRRHQEFWFNEMKARTPDWNANKDTLAQFRRDFIYMMDDKLAFCNSAGSRERRVYPYNLNMQYKGEPLQNQLTMGGSILELVDDSTRMVFHEECRPFYCIDAFDKHLEDYNSFDYPYRWLRPCITYGPDVIHSEPFSTFHGCSRVPMYCNGTNIAWIPARLVEVLEPGKPIKPQFTKDWGS